MYDMKMRSEKMTSDDLKALKYFIGIRWPVGVTCLDCKHNDVALVVSRGIFQCKKCRNQFTVFKNTRFEGMRLSPNQLHLALSLFHSTSDSCTVRRLQAYMMTSSYSSAHRLFTKINIFKGQSGYPRFDDFVRLLFK